VNIQLKSAVNGEVNRASKKTSYGPKK
jgi:hypothetical protein